MSRVALVRNPISTGHLKTAPGTAAPPPEAPPGVALIECGSLEDLSAGLAEAHAGGAEVILVAGGDGTVREVLSRIPEIWGAALPCIGILPRGNTNLIAREVGGLGGNEAIAEVLRRLDSGAELPVRRLRLMRLDYPAGEHRSLRGFILGWGAYAAGTRIAREEIAARGAGQAARAVLATLRRGFFGAERKILRRGVKAAMSIDGARSADSPRLLGLATTLREPLIAGINPFWGDGPGAIRWLDVHAPGKCLAIAVPFAVFGRPRRWMTRSGYHSGLANRIELDLDTSFIMDGETFPPAQAGPLILTADEEISFIAL